MEDVSGKAPEHWAIELMLPLHNLLLPKRTEYFKQKLCTKKVHHNKKMSPAGWAGYLVTDPFSKAKRKKR